MERNAGVTAGAGPGRDSGNAEVVVSHTLPLLAQQENSHPPHSPGFGIDGSRDLDMNQAWRNNLQCQTIPKSRAVQNTSGHGFLIPVAFPTKPHPTKSIQ